MLCPHCGAANSPQATACQSCASPLQAPDRALPGAPGLYSPALGPGAQLSDGAFAIAEVLGQGGFGITYRADDVLLRRGVAIKEFFPHGCGRSGLTVLPSTQAQPGFEEARRSFVQEATTLARFSHEGIVRVFGVFEENNTAYMVMELLEGRSLRQRLDERGVTGEREALGIIEKVGAALEAVHSSKMLHRDIKPDNIILTNGGRVVLIDFGTAREFAAGRTRSMTTMVTHGYAPLEQYGQAARFGPYTDVYALGATLYCCLTGQPPVSALDRVSGEDLPAPESLNPNLSRAVSLATMKALEIKVADRFQSVGEFIAALHAPVPVRIQKAEAPSTALPTAPPAAPSAARWPLSPSFPPAPPAPPRPAPPRPAQPPPARPGMKRPVAGSAWCWYCDNRIPPGASSCPYCYKPLGSPVMHKPLKLKPSKAPRTGQPGMSWIWLALWIMLQVMRGCGHH